jgi:TPR repeat protein
MGKGHYLGGSTIFSIKDPNWCADVQQRETKDAKSKQIVVKAKKPGERQEKYFLSIFKQNPTSEQRRLFKKIMDGDLKSAHRLALIAIEQGKSGYPFAIKLLKQAAEAGHSEAQNELGVLYFKGKVVARNLSNAAEWCAMACANGMGNGHLVRVISKMNLKRLAIARARIEKLIKRKKVPANVLAMFDSKKVELEKKQFAVGTDHLTVEDVLIAQEIS